MTQTFTFAFKPAGARRYNAPKPVLAEDLPQAVAREFTVTPGTTRCTEVKHFSGTGTARWKAVWS